MKRLNTSGEDALEPVVYDITDYNHSVYGDVLVILDPDQRYIYNYAPIGNSGSPEPLWNRRHITLCSVSKTSVAAELKSMLQEMEGETEALISCYEGSNWDGHNICGSWSDATDDAESAWELAWQLKIDSRPVPTYWSAAEWLYDWDIRYAVSALADYCSISTVAEDLVDVGQCQGAWLDLDDVEGYVSSILEKYVRVELPYTALEVELWSESPIVGVEKISYHPNAYVDAWVPRELVAEALPTLSEVCEGFVGLKYSGDVGADDAGMIMIC